MAKKADPGQALKKFVMKLGVPEELAVDGSKDQNSSGTEFMKCCWKNYISLTRADPEIPNQNPAEGVIIEVQRQWFQNMIRKIVPRKIWDYGFQWTTQVMQRTSTQLGGLRGI